MGEARTSTVDRFSLLISALALAVSAGSGVVAWVARQDSLAATERANKISQDAFELAAETAEREIASKVFVSEAPPKYEGAGAPIWAVSNASGVDVTQVWVRGERHGNDSYIAIGDLQQCYLYTLTNEPNGFVPSELHFFDGTSHWLRDRDGSLGKDRDPRRPASLKAAGDAYVHQMVGGCGG